MPHTVKSLNLMDNISVPRQCATLAPTSGMGSFPILSATIGRYMASWGGRPARETAPASRPLHALADDVIAARFVLEALAREAAKLAQPGANGGRK